MCCVCFLNVDVVPHRSRTQRQCCCQHDSSSIHWTCGSIHPSLMQAFWWASNKRKRRKKGDKVSGIDWDMPFVFCAVTNVVLSHAQHRPHRWCQPCSSSPSPHLSWYRLLELKETRWRQQEGEQSWCACLQLKTLLKDILSYTPLMLHPKTPGASKSSRIYASRGGIFQYWSNVYHIWFANECVAIAIETKLKSKEI